MLRKIFINTMILLLPVISFAEKSQTELKLPLKTDIEKGGITYLLKVVLSMMMDISVPVLVIALVYVGFLFVKSQGEPNKLEEAKKALTVVIIGIFLILIFYTLFNIYYHD